MEEYWLLCYMDHAYLNAAFLFTGSIVRSASRRYLIYSEADFEVFRHVAPMGVKFGMEEGTEGPLGPLLRAKFHPHRCNV